MVAYCVKKAERVQIPIQSRPTAQPCKSGKRRRMKDLVSIIIPCKEMDSYTQRCLNFCEQVDYPNKEIMVVPDYLCPGFPATKRNWAMQRAKGTIFAFIDSDAYPSKDWLKNATDYLKLPKIAAVCGPGVLPPDAPLLEQATDLVYRWLPYSYRVTPKKQRLVKEFPTFNLIVKKAYAPQFKNYLTGEDSLFCRELSGRILYDPSILVYHNRRPLFRPYWRQVGTYGFNRGQLIRLALLGWLSTWVVYPANFVRGLLKRRG